MISAAAAVISYQLSKSVTHVTLSANAGMLTGMLSLVCLHDNTKCVPIHKIRS